MDQLADADLVRRSAGGDSAVFIELINAYKGSLAALIRRLVSDADEAEDLLQETLLQSWLKIGSMNNPEKVQAWLLQIARNLCRDYHRSAQRRINPTKQEELEYYVNRYGRTAVPAEAALDLLEAMDNLPLAEQKIVELFYLHGFTIKEICRQIQAPVGTVKYQLHSARHHLRSFLDEAEENGGL
ncbi:RNA polymerase sigma factor [bacterium]|nr:RNA polymerase sigma factor [bacterium]